MGCPLPHSLYPFGNSLYSSLQHAIGRVIVVVVFCLLGFNASATPNQDREGRKNYEDLNSDIKETLFELFRQSASGERLAKESVGMLIFPSVIKAGIGLGGEYGEGALIIGEEIAEYYNLKGVSLGVQLGVHSKSLVILFLADEEVNHFRTASGWQMSLDGALTLAKLGLAGEVNFITSRRATVGYVFNNRGLIYDLSIKGAKLSKLPKGSEEKSPFISWRSPTNTVPSSPAQPATLSIPQSEKKTTSTPSSTSTQNEPSSPFADNARQTITPNVTYSTETLPKNTPPDNTMTNSALDIHDPSTP